MLAVGRPGRPLPGKAAAIEGRWATRMRFYAGPRLLVVDEPGYLALPADAAATLFQVINTHYANGSSTLG